MPGKRWKEWEISRLKSLLNKGLAPSEMVIGSRTTVAIDAQASRLGLVGDGIPRRPWPIEDVNTLQDLLGQGLTIKQMAESGQLNGHSISAIAKKKSRLGLVDPQRSVRSRGAVFMSVDQKIEFCEFLCRHAASCTPEQMALMWNRKFEPPVNHRRVVRYLTLLGIKRPWSEVMQMAYSKAKRARRSLKCLCSQQKRWRAYRRHRRQQLEELAKNMRRDARRAGIKLCCRRCCECARHWPAQVSFFAVTRKSTRAGPRTYLSRRCKLCWAERRLRRDRHKRRQAKRKKPAARQSR